VYLTRLKTVFEMVVVSNDHLDVLNDHLDQTLLDKIDIEISRLELKKTLDDLNIPFKCGWCK
jgi:hypothetical protein